MSSRTFPERFVGLVQVEGTTVEIFFILQGYDVGAVANGFTRQTFDLDGNVQSEEELFFFAPENPYVSAKIKVLTSAVTDGLVFSVESGTLIFTGIEDTYALVTNRIDPVSGARPVSLHTFTGQDQGGQAVERLIYALEDRVYSLDPMDTGPPLSLEIADIRYARVLDYDQVLVVTGDFMGIYDFELNLLRSNTLPADLSHFYLEGDLLHALSREQEDFNGITATYRHYTFHAGQLLPESDRAIAGAGAVIHDFFAEQGRLYVLSASASGAQVALQTFDLDLPALPRPFVDLEADGYTVVEDSVYYYFSPTLKATLHIPVKNLSDEAITQIRYSSYLRHWGSAGGCGSRFEGTQSVELLYLDEDTLVAEVHCNKYRGVPGGREYTCPCIDIYAYEHVFDHFESNNRICPVITIPPIVGTHGDAGLPDAAWQVYPTLFDDVLFVDFDTPLEEELSWEIADLHGRTAASGAIPAGASRLTAPVGIQAPGMYILHLVETGTGKLLGQKKLIRR